MPDPKNTDPGAWQREMAGGLPRRRKLKIVKRVSKEPYVQYGKNHLTGQLKPVTTSPPQESMLDRMVREARVQQTKDQRELKKPAETPKPKKVAATPKPKKVKAATATPKGKPLKTANVGKGKVKHRIKGLEDKIKSARTTNAY